VKPRGARRSPPFLRSLCQTRVRTEKAHEESSTEGRATTMTKIVLVGGVTSIETENHVQREAWGIYWADEDGRVRSLPWHRVSEMETDPVEPGIAVV
jgi:hypothetical protein